MRVLIVTPYYAPAWGYGGPVRSVRNLARGLAAAGVQVEVVTTDADPAGRADVPPVRQEDGVVIRTFPRRFGQVAPFRMFFLADGMSAYLRERVRDFDIVHLQGLFVWPTRAGARACAEAGVPYVVSPRGSLGRWGLRQKALKKRIYIWLVERETLAAAAAVHYTLSAERDEAPAWARRLPGVVVPNGVEFAPPADGAAWRRRHGIDPSAFVVGMVGRIHPKKGIDRLLEAAARAVREGKEVRLALVGGGEEAHVAAVRRDVARLGLEARVTFTGLLDGAEVAGAYAGIDLLALPSREENFGNVIVEALAQGTPVAVTEGLALADWIRERSAGTVLPPGPDAWARFLAALPDRASPKDPSLRERAEASFEYRAVAREMLDAYAGILGRGAGCAS